MSTCLHQRQMMQQAQCVRSHKSAYNLTMRTVLSVDGCKGWRDWQVESYATTMSSICETITPVISMRLGSAADVASPEVLHCLSCVQIRRSTAKRVVWAWTQEPRRSRIMWPAKGAWRLQRIQHTVVTWCAWDGCTALAKLN